MVNGRKFSWKIERVRYINIWKFQLEIVLCHFLCMLLDIKRDGGTMENSKLSQEAKRMCQNIQHETWIILFIDSTLLGKFRVFSNNLDVQVSISSFSLRILWCKFHLRILSWIWLTHPCIFYLPTQNDNYSRIVSCKFLIFCG